MATERMQAQHMFFTNEKQKVSHEWIQPRMAVRCTVLYGKGHLIGSMRTTKKIAPDNEMNAGFKSEVPNTKIKKKKQKKHAFISCTGKTRINMYMYIHCKMDILIHTLRVVLYNYTVSTPSNKFISVKDHLTSATSNCRVESRPLRNIQFDNFLSSCWMYSNSVLNVFYT